MWLVINELLFGGPYLKWICLVSAVVTAGIAAAVIPTTDSVRFAFILVVVPSLYVLTATASYIILKDRHKAVPSALDILHREHADLRVAVRNLTTAHMVGAQTEAIARFMDVFDQHHDSEERAFFFAIREAFPKRLAPQFYVFSGRHLIIDMIARRLNSLVGTPDFEPTVRVLEAAVEDHIQEEERTFPDILRVAGPKFLRQIAPNMGRSSGAA